MRTGALARQQMVELIGRKKLPVRGRYRNHKAIHGELAGQYHRNDCAGTEIYAAMVVFYSFDDECHLAHDTVRTRQFRARQLNPVSVKLILPASRVLTRWNRDHTHIG